MKVSLKDLTAKIPGEPSAQWPQGERYALGFDYPKRYVEQVAAVTPEQTVAAARRHIKPDAMIEVVVGPAAPPPGTDGAGVPK